MRKRNVFLVLVLITGIINASSFNVFAKGHFEIRPFYGLWSLNIVRRPIETALTEALESNIRAHVGDDFSQAIMQSFTDATFDSNGSFAGFELRWYPSGENGVWSLGIGIERTSFEATARGESTLLLEGDVRVDLIPVGTMKLEVPLIYLTTQWTLFPSWRFRPYIGLGAGISPLKGNLTYSALGVVTQGNLVFPYGYSESTRLEDIEDISISIIPYLIGYIGIQGKLFPSVFLALDAGVLNGFSTRFSVSLRF